MSQSLQRSAARRAHVAAVLRIALAVAGAPAALLVSPGSGDAQYVRVNGASTVRFVELRTLARDSVASDSTDGSALLRQLPDGRVVRCIPGESYCRSTAPGPLVNSLPVVHDLDVSAWGFGRGIRLFAQLRARQTLGGAGDLWPREDDRFDVLALYGEMQRGSVRVRAGRQHAVTGLGFYNFDGLSVALRPAPAAAIEAYVGRSLIRGLNETRAGEAIEAIEALPPSNAGTLVGFHARYRPSLNVALGATYQADFRLDGRGLYSELVTTNGEFRYRGYTLAASVEVDAAAADLNEARVRVQTPALGQFAPFAEVRRYRPYFELWTIWGAFSPVGFDEARVGTTWSRRDGQLLLRGDVVHRSYGRAELSETLDDYRTRGWGVHGSGIWTVNTAWTASASYGLESGFGASGWDAQAGARRTLGTAGWLALQGTLFERLYEFRLTEGVVAGLGGEAAFPVGERTRLIANLSAYRHMGGGAADGVDWNQRRASVRLQWSLGAEPVASGGGR